MLIFEDKIENAVEGIHYVKRYDLQANGSEVGKEFMIAGFGTGGEFTDPNHDANYDRSMSVLRRGFNHVSKVENNLVYYTMERKEDGGHDMEVSGHKGDSGSGALFMIDGEI